ncbi:MAG: hypothetical protein N2450_07645 [bacterium]|nr:hypothetical protein [bacterium]
MYNISDIQVSYFDSYETAELGTIYRFVVRAEIWGVLYQVMVDYQLNSNGSVRRIAPTRVWLNHIDITNFVDSNVHSIATKEIIPMTLQKG